MPTLGPSFVDAPIGLAGCSPRCSALGRVNATKSFDDQSEIDEADKHHVEFLESRENASKSLQASEQSLDLVAPLVHRAIVFPCIDSIALGRYHGDEV